MGRTIFAAAALLTPWFPTYAQQTLKSQFESLGADGTEVLRAFATSFNTNLAVPATGNSIQYEFDLETGIPTRVPGSMGPAFTSRATTIGGGRTALGFSALVLEFDSVDGLDFSSGEFSIPADTPLGPRTGVATQVLARAEALALQFSASHGITDDIDVSVTVPLLSLRAIGSGEIAVGSTTLPFQTEITPSFRLADIAVQAKWRFLERSSLNLAASVLVQLPTGDSENFLGLEQWRVQPNLLASKRYKRFSVHINFGLDIGETDLLANALNYRAAADFLVSDRVNVFAEVLGKQYIDSDRLNVATLFSSRERAPSNQSDAALGFKLNLAGTVVLTTTAVFPLNPDSGDRGGPNVLAGIEAGF